MGCGAVCGPPGGGDEPQRQRGAPVLRRTRSGGLRPFVRKASPWCGGRRDGRRRGAARNAGQVTRLVRRLAKW